MDERILLCLCHMSGQEQKYIDEAFADNWVVPLGPNVNGFEKDLENFFFHNPGLNIADSQTADYEKKESSPYLPEPPQSISDWWLSE